MPDIDIKLSATGADQAAAEINKVADATAHVARTTASGTGATAEAVSLKEEIDLMREKERAARRYAQELDAISNQQGLEAARETDRANFKFKVASTAAIAAASKLAFDELSLVKQALESIDTVDLRKINSAMADQVEAAQDWAKALDHPIEALLKLATGTTVADATAAMNEQIKLTAQSLESGVSRFLASGQRTSAEIKEFVIDLQAANAIMNAQDALDSAKGKRADATAIRNGAAPEDVAADRAKVDGQQRIDALNREQEIQAAKLQAAWNDLQEEKKRRTQLEQKTTSGSPEEGAAARKGLDESRKKIAADQAAFDDKHADYITLQAVNARKRQAIREESAGTVEEQKGNKVDRLQKEQDKAAKEREREEEKSKRENEKADREAKQARDKADRQREAEARRQANLETEASGIGTAAGKASREAGLPPNIAAGFEKLGARIAKKGDPSGDATLAAQMLTALEKSVSLMEAQHRGNDPAAQKMRELERRIEILTRQVKNK